MKLRDVEVIMSAYKEGVVPLKAAVLALGVYRAQAGKLLDVRTVIEVTGASRSRSYAALRAVSKYLVFETDNCPGIQDKTVLESRTNRPGIQDKSSRNPGQNCPGIQDDTLLTEFKKKEEERRKPPISPPGGAAGGIFTSGLRPERRRRRPTLRRDPEAWAKQLEEDLEGL